ncbi:MAG: DUF1905 domain-containing protein [Acidobacteria bacterium]|nr:DUF1905 domain-containing protein [Acidobacteriota bacterium]
MADKQTFEAVLEKHPKMDAAGITIPFDVEKVFGKRRVPVVIEINGEQYRTTIAHMGGKYSVHTPKEYRTRAGIVPGERIVITLWQDLEKRSVELPEDLAKALKTIPEGLKTWEKLSYTTQKEHVRSVESAKQPETRIRRIQKIVDSMRPNRANRDDSHSP